MHFNYTSSATGLGISLPALLQPKFDNLTFTGMADRHHVPVLRPGGLHLPLQPDLHVPLLPVSGGWLVPWPHRRLRRHVPVRRRLHDVVRPRRQHAVPGPGLHHHAGLCLEQTKSLHTDELFRPVEFSGTVSTVGTAGVLLASGQLHCRGYDGYSGWPCLFLLGRRVSQSAWRIQDSESSAQRAGPVRGGSSRPDVRPTAGGAARRLRLGRPATGTRRRRPVTAVSRPSPTAPDRRRSPRTVTGHPGLSPVTRDCDLSLRTVTDHSGPSPVTRDRRRSPGTVTFRPGLSPVTRDRHRSSGTVTGHPGL